MVLPTKLNPRFSRSLERASLSSVFAGTPRGCYACVDRPAPGEAPHVGVEGSKFLLDREKSPRVFHRAVNFKPIAHQPGLSSSFSMRAGVNRATFAGSNPAKPAGSAHVCAGSSPN